MKKKYFIIKENFKHNQTFNDFLQIIQKEKIVFQAFESFIPDIFTFRIKYKFPSQEYFKIERENIEPAPEHLVVAARLRGEI